MEAIMIKPLHRGEKATFMDEKEALATTAGYSVREIMITTPKKYPLGRGKLEELSRETVDTLIILTLLTPDQKFKMHEKTGKDIIDFYDLVLRVFEQHAQSREAKIQIELARIQKEQPRITKELNLRVKKEHPGYSGGGEYVLHSHLTNLKNRISRLERELMLYEKRKEKERTRRKNVISLAGYTNSGKSTIFNRLTKSSQRSGKEPFTTLQTKSRFLYADGKRVVLNDTIGFISDLPPGLIAPFRATLGDIVHSKFILLVVDVNESVETMIKKMDICSETLRKIGVNRDKTRIITVFNKIDLVPYPEKKIEETGIKEGYVAVSGLSSENLGALRSIFSSI